jgi:parallel beta-helix repeat protein
MVVDNTDATFVGDWAYHSTNPQRYGNDVRYHSEGDGTGTATWTPVISEDGDYNVYAWWIEGSQRATNAPYTIYYNGGSETVRINQKEPGSGGKWNYLGTYPFAAGTSGYVVLSDGPDANGVVLADAIMIVRLPQGVIINSDNITIASGAKISADGEGFPHDAGPGKGPNAGDCSGGGGYGGRGGNGRDSAGGPTYGTMYEPTALGSGGGGGASGRGAGAIKLNVTNTLTLNGTISANGTQGLGNYAGGSGGSIWLICDTFAGQGSITANGGKGANTTYPGGGGGGRIHTSRTTWAYTGTLGVSGGTGRNSGYDGTIYDNNPFLEWTGEANYESDGLHPEWGDGSTMFTYRIKYSHIYDFAPTEVNVHILLDGVDIPFGMAQVGGGPTYVDGFIYEYSTLLPEGTYSYYFEAPVPNCGPAMGEGAIELTGPSVLEVAATNLDTLVEYPRIQDALDEANFGETIQVKTGFIHFEQIAIPSGVTVFGDPSDPNATIIISDIAPVVSFDGVSSGSSIEGFTIRYTGENLIRDGSARQFYIDIGNGSSDIGIDKCLIGRDGYVSGWTGSDSRYLATTLFNDGGVRVGSNCSDISITNCKIRYLTGPGIGIATGSNQNINISNNHIYRNILPWDVRGAPYLEAPGIGLNGTARPTIMSNEIYSNNVGIGSYALTGTDGTAGTIYIEGNVIHHNNLGGIGFNVQSGSYFRSAEIVGNDIYSNLTGREGGGIRVHNAYDLKIRENHVHHNGRGIYVYRTYDAEIDKNDVYSNNRGFLVSYAYGPKIRQNYIHDNGSKIPALYCVYLYDFDIYNNKIYRNGHRNGQRSVYLNVAGVSEKDQSFFHNNILEGTSYYSWKGYGLRVDRGANIVFSSNIFSNFNNTGVYFYNQAGPIDFRHNKVSNNGRSGVRVLTGAFRGNIFKNLFVGNNWAGIRFENDVSGDLEIYNNTIADNGQAGTTHRGAGIAFGGGLTTSTYSLFHNIFAFNDEAGYRYGDETWPQKERWDWVDKHDNFFFWNHGSLAGGLYNQERTQFINAQWGGPGGSGTNDITMEVAHWDYDQNAWDFSGNPPYSLGPFDVTGVLELADGYQGGAYSEYLGRSASYTVADPPDLAGPGDPYVEPPAVAPPAIPPVPVVPSPFPE